MKVFRIDRGNGSVGKWQLSPHVQNQHLAMVRFLLRWRIAIKIDPAWNRDPPAAQIHFQPFLAPKLPHSHLVTNADRAAQSKKKHIHFITRHAVPNPC